MDQIVETTPQGEDENAVMTQQGNYSKDMDLVPTNLQDSCSESNSENQDILLPTGDMFKVFGVSTLREKELIEEGSNRNNSHQILMKMNQDRTYLGQFTDIKLLVGEAEVPIQAHKVVLVSCSEYFRGMLTTPMKEATQDEIKLPMLKAEVLENILKFIYTGEIKINGDNIGPVMFTADYIDLTSLVAICKKYIMKRVNLYNCVEILKDADHYNFLSLNTAVRKYIINNFKEVFEENLDLPSLPTDLLTDIIAHPRAVVHLNPSKNEEQLFKLLWNSLPVNTSQREANIATILKTVHLPQMGNQCLNHIEHMVSEFPSALDIIKSSRERFLEWQDSGNEPHPYSKSFPRHLREALLEVVIEEPQKFKEKGSKLHGPIKYVSGILFNVIAFKSTDHPNKLKVGLCKISPIDSNVYFEFQCINYNWPSSKHTFPKRNQTVTVTHTYDWSQLLDEMNEHYNVVTNTLTLQVRVVVDSVANNDQ